MNLTTENKNVPTQDESRTLLIKNNGLSADFKYPAIRSTIPSKKIITETRDHPTADSTTFDR